MERTGHSDRAEQSRAAGKQRVKEMKRSELKLTEKFQEFNSKTDFQHFLSQHTLERERNINNVFLKGKKFLIFRGIQIYFLEKPDILIQTKEC